MRRWTRRWSRRWHSDRRLVSGGCQGRRLVRRALEIGMPAAIQVPAVVPTAQPSARCPVPGAAVLASGLAGTIIDHYLASRQSTLMHR